MSGSSSDIIIALMGVTGAGKSSLIRLLTQDDSVRIGHTLTSETTEIQQYHLRHGGRNYILVDTPGFDDTYRANSDIVTDLLSWLTTSFRAGTRLNGILYLHRVSDIRMTGSAFENLRMFRNLVGEDALNNVILVTTFWDTVSFNVAEEREMELMKNKQFWGRMMEKGCKVWRLRDRTDRGKALKIIESVNGGKFTLQAQREIVVEGRNFRDTAAAREIAQATAEFERRLAEERERAKAELIQREAQEKRRIREEKERMVREAEMQRSLEYDLRQLREEHERRVFEREHARLLGEARRQEQEIQARFSRIHAACQEEEKRAQEQQRRMRQQYYRSYKCIGKHVSKYRLCDGCGKNIHEKWKYYYHCCHCDNDDWNQCGDCGRDCGVAEHPAMDPRLTKDVDSCLIM